MPVEFVPGKSREFVSNFYLFTKKNSDTPTQQNGSTMV